MSSLFEWVLKVYRSLMTVLLDSPSCGDLDMWLRRQGQATGVVGMAMAMEMEMEMEWRCCRLHCPGMW